MAIRDRSGPENDTLESAPGESLDGQEDCLNAQQTNDTTLIGPFGCLRRYVDSDKVTREYLHAELGSLCAGETLRHKSAQPTILYRQRGVSISAIALRYATLENANLPGIGRTLTFT